MALFTFNGIEISALAAALPTRTGGTKPRWVCSEHQTASDLGYVAASKILKSLNVDAAEIGSIIFLSTTPDYRSPATACVLQNRLGLTKDCLAYDVNVGGLGFLLGLQLGCSLLNSINRKAVLIVVGDTPSKQLSEGHEAIAFTDAGCAMLLRTNEHAMPIRVKIKSSGHSYNSFTISGGGFRSQKTHTNEKLYINQDSIADLMGKHLPDVVNGFLKDTRSSLSQYDLITLPATSEEVFSTIRTELGPPLPGALHRGAEVGDARGSATGLLLANLFSKAGGGKDIHALSCGFGEGVSWGIADFFIRGGSIFPTIETSEFYHDAAVSRSF